MELSGHDLQRRLDHEWLLTDGAGGFAMGTVGGVPQRRYHALFIAATKPPVGRVALVQAVADWLIVGQPNEPEFRYQLSGFQFSAPDAQRAKVSELLVGFSTTESTGESPAACEWTFEILHYQIALRVSRRWEFGSAVARMSYGVHRTSGEPLNAGWQVESRPLLSLRDFHSLGNAPGRLRTLKDGQFVASVGDVGVCIEAHSGTAIRAEETWRDLYYRRDAQRGQDATEDLWSPVTFRLGPWGSIYGATGLVRPSLVFALVTEAQQERPHIHHAHSTESPSNERWRDPSPPQHVASTALPPSLSAAAAQFIATRNTPSGPKPSIIAGYPWFSDWGRDTMISLPGLLLCTGRHDEARDTLLAFAGLMKDGLIPNCFDNGSGEAEYNTVDASLWFIQAVCNLAGAALAPVPPELIIACRSIIDAYRIGTRFNIRMDPADSLIMAGDLSTQLTWMDARRNGVVFTPRHGKPIEINALWHSGLMRFAALIGPSHPAEADALRTVAAQTAASFRSAFWNPHDGCLFDCLVPNGPSWDADASIRPNQVFAVSLPHSPLTNHQQRSVVASLKKHLLTPMGLRTLAAGSHGYRPRFEGDLFSRDGAYHNGTVWPWLIGPYIEALLRSHDFSAAARTEGRAALQPLLDEFNGAGATSRSVASIAEVYDADDAPGKPRRPDGCPMQAWSVAEVLRSLVLLSGPAPASLGQK